MSERRVMKRRGPIRTKRMGWKSKRNKEIKIYLAIFLLCILIAGIISIIRGRNVTTTKRAVETETREQS